MNRRSASIVLIVLLASLCSATLPLAAVEIDQHELAAPASPAATSTIEPLAFFEMLVERYRRIAFYSDRVRLTQTFARSGESPRRLDTEFACAIDEEGLRVQTAARQAATAMGLAPSIRTTPTMRRLKQRYDLWLAPHMMLKFAREPLQEFRDGVREGFTPTDAASVTVDEHPMVHVKLESAPDPDESQRAIFDLYVNPESMLIERIEGAQQLADGTSLVTTLDIEPVAIDTAAAANDASSLPEIPTGLDAPEPELDSRPVPAPLVSPGGPLPSAGPQP